MYGVDGQGSCSDSHAGIVFPGFDINCFPTTISYMVCTHIFIAHPMGSQSAGISSRVAEPNRQLSGCLPCSDHRRRAKSDRTWLRSKLRPRPRPRVRGWWAALLRYLPTSVCMPMEHRGRWGALPRSRPVDPPVETLTRLGPSKGWSRQRSYTPCHDGTQVTRRQVLRPP